MELCAKPEARMETIIASKSFFRRLLNGFWISK